MFEPFKGKFSFTTKEYQMVKAPFDRDFIVCEMTNTKVILIRSEFNPIMKNVLHEYDLEYYNNVGLPYIDTFTDKHGYITKLLKNKELYSVDGEETQYLSRIYI